MRSWGEIVQETLRENCTYLEFFWSVFTRIWTEYGEIRSIQSKCGKIRTRETRFGHLLRNEMLFKTWLSFKHWLYLIKFSYELHFKPLKSTRRFFLYKVVSSTTVHILHKVILSVFLIVSINYFSLKVMVFFSPKIFNFVIMARESLSNGNHLALLQYHFQSMIQYLSLSSRKRSLPWASQPALSCSKSTMKTPEL